MSLIAGVFAVGDIRDCTADSDHCTRSLKISDLRIRISQREKKLAGNLLRSECVIIFPSEKSLMNILCDSFSCKLVFWV